MRKPYKHLWAIFLAGGDGVRMREYLKTRRNIDRPKQFENIIGTHSMVRHTIERTKRIVPMQRVRIVVNNQQETPLHLYRKSLPKVYRQINSMKQLLTSPGGIEKLDGQFTRLPSYGFSKTIMEPNAKHLRVIRAEGVVWSDWGNQSRVTSDLSKMAIGLQ